MNQLTDAEFLRLAEFVRSRYGINLEKKRELIVARLSFYISQQGFASFTDYLNLVTAGDSNPRAADERQRMIDRLSTNHTFFFREPACLEHIVNKAVPQLIAAGTGSIRIWCAAASSGQECYSLAMLLDSRLRLNGCGADFRILGSDISRRMLDRAEAGVYDIGELEAIPVSCRRLYTSVCGKTFTISPALRAKISWERINLMEPFPARLPFDIILCRNVMFYFLPETRAELTEKLCRELRTGGWLYVGLTENIGAERRLLRYEAPSIYQKM